MPNVSYQFLLFFSSLLFVGIAFWTAGDLLTKQLFSFSYRTLDKLQVETLPQVMLMLDFKIIEMEIDPEEKFTQVKIKTGNSLLKRLELEIPNSSSPEVAIAKELKLDPQLKQLPRNQQIKVKIPLDLMAIKATIEKQQGYSFVEVITFNHALKKLDFQLPIVEINMVESMISQLLNLSAEDVRKLVSYQIKHQTNKLN
jgi:hypothetical protein